MRDERQRSGSGRQARTEPASSANDPGRLATVLARHRRVQVEDLPAGALEVWVARGAVVGPCLWVAPDDDAAEASARRLAALGLADVAWMPGEDHSPFGEVGHDAARTGQSLRLRHRLAAAAAPQVMTVAASTLLGTWPAKADFLAAVATVRVDDEVDRPALLAHLAAMGYQPASPAHDEGTYCVRGGIIDIFVPGDAHPHRLDLFGDTLAELVTFSAESQRTVGRHRELAITPAREVVLDAPHRQRAQAWVAAQAQAGIVPSRTLSWLRDQIAGGHFFFGIESLSPIFFADTKPRVDELVGPFATLVVDGDEAVAAALNERVNDNRQQRERAAADHRPHLPLASLQASMAHVEACLNPLPRLSRVTLALPEAGMTWSHQVTPTALARGPGDEPMAALAALLRRSTQDGGRAWICCATVGRVRAVDEMLRGRSLQAERGAGLDRVSAPVSLVQADMPASFHDRRAGLLVVSDVDLFPKAASGLGRGRRLSGQARTSLEALAVGDWVVHRDHGVACYQGLTKLLVGGIVGDFLELHYAGDDKLFVPVTSVAQVRTWRGPATAARADRLGGSRWLRAQQRVKTAVLAVAHGLLAMQAQRRVRRGFALPAPCEQYTAFAASFIHEETPDQRRAIEETLADLQKDTPMDRLLCADVGFGKTEVALRAAFVAVTGGRQALVLVPTTVLAEQHRATFAERMAPFGVQVGVLSRFQDSEQQAATLRELSAGTLDVLIGTHRLLSADVAPRRLGLLVVDEEQRFGVKHKERIKQMSRDVHVLSMSATPIPRTLHMAMVGLRDLSIIRTPPASRAAIRTEVLREDQGAIAGAIRREIHRGGQVFVVYNRVRGIDELARNISEWVPEARILVAHGQMPSERLERMMVEFVQHRHDVLVATAIIESGLDIPSVNTMIVIRADNFGLSQLHQLRGRIGRGSQRAYAYMMLPADEQLGKPALERLAALKRFSDLGAGFQLASHDLELRGAGDLLGAEQSGHVAAVGLELYTELLAEAVEHARGRGDEAGGQDPEPDLKLPVAAVLPESFIPDPAARLALYQRLSEADSDPMVFDIIGEIAGIWGEPPPEVEALGEAMVIRRRLRAVGALALSAQIVESAAELRVGVTFAAASRVDRADLARRCRDEPGRYRLTPSGRLAITIGWPAQQPAAQALALIRHAVGELKSAAGASA